MSKRISSTSVRWAYIVETLLPEDQPKISLLKTQCDKYLRQISSTSAELPKIDWNFYKSKISVPGLVDSFQKNFESLQIPYPSGKDELAAVDSENKKMTEFGEKILNEMLENIKLLKKELKEKESVMKLSEMTMEELYLARPDFRIDNINNPQKWPQFFEEPGVKETKHA